MYDRQRKLQSAVACEGKQGRYYAKVHTRTKRTGYRPIEVALQREAPDLSQLGVLWNRISNSLEIDTAKIAAVELYRSCDNRRHVNGETTPYDSEYLERATSSLVVAKANTLLDVANKHPNASPSNESYQHGALLNPNPYIVPYDPVLFLGVLARENATHPVHGVIEAAISEHTNELFVAIRGLERIVTSIELGQS